jgi:HD-GYP domain-containing protein (c-di-GMP phosphodiesterase class II)
MLGGVNHVKIVPLMLGVASGALVAHTRQRRDNAERLAAALLETLLNAVDANDPDTGAHVRRVARYALILADAADLEEHAQRAIERVALFHDIGKIHQALFDIVHDERKLTDEERRAIATHPQRGAEVLAPLAPFYPELGEAVLSHHERWDGSGYPRRLRGEEIPFAARIVAIADTFDAVTHSRRYRSGRGAGHGVDVVRDGRGTQFDPDLADLFVCPPVVEQVADAMKEAAASRAPRRAPRDRRQGRREPAPDVSFRWRTPTPAPLPPATESRTPP